eukprot:189233-Pelagomonas_calceolata.AAC.6
MQALLHRTCMPLESAQACEGCQQAQHGVGDVVVADGHHAQARELRCKERALLQLLTVLPLQTRKC